MKPIAVPVKLQHIKITDALFGEYTSLVAKQILPYQWSVLNDLDENAEKSYCAENFRVAAGEKEGGHHGAIFQDTDAYKWIEAVAFCIANKSGTEYAEKADWLIDLIARAQEPDGYLNTYIAIERPDLKWDNLVEGHELYSAGHLIEAAVAYYEATGKDKLLNVAKRLADLIDTVFGPEEGKKKGCPGHQEIELALIKLYRVTNEQKYLKLAKFFIDIRGQQENYLMDEYKRHGGYQIFPEFAEYDAEYAQIHAPARKQTQAVGHAVRAVYMYSAMADLAAEYGDKELAEACDTLYKNTVERRMYITGGIGSSGKLERFTADYDLPNETMYCESCASIGLMMFGQRMAALTGEASYYDTVERALCNTVLAGIQQTGDRYFYVNPLSVWPDNCKPSTSMSHVKPVRQKWFVCACCPPNIARTLASLGHYIYSQTNDTLFINQPISSTVNAPFEIGELFVDMKADYMQNGKINIKAQSKAEGNLTIKLRMPPYLKKAAVTLDGKAVTPLMQQGYAVFTIPANSKAEIEINAEVMPEFIAANRAVRADAGQLAVMKGPYVYCLEQQDNGENLASLYVNPENGITQLPPVEGLAGALPSLSLKGKRIVKTTKEPQVLYGTADIVKENANLTAVPYALWCNRTPGEMQVWIKAEI